MNEDMMHDISNYLHQIISNAELIENGREVSHYANKIKKSAYRIDALMADGAKKKTKLYISKGEQYPFNLKKISALNIMIVDDLDDNIEIMKNIFNTFSCNICSANSGEAALKLFRNGFIADIVCMDIIMPGMDGFTATKKLKSIGSSAYFIAVSALKNQSHDDMSLFDAWLPKPFMSEHIIGALVGYETSKNKMQTKENDKFKLDISDEIKKEILYLAKGGAYSALEKLIGALENSNSKVFLYSALKRVDLNLIITTIES
ncbi:MAG: response regulator [Campylobacterales bacterium]|nr:response regulator [Campylobacterales bacterium]